MRFIYHPNQGMIDLIRNNIANYGNDFLYGYVEDGSIGQLNRLSLYLVCELNIIGSMHYYINPLAIVAKNDYDSSRIYNEQMGRDASVMCLLENNAAKAKVEPVE